MTSSQYINTYNSYLAFNIMVYTPSVWLDPIWHLHDCIYRNVERKLSILMEEYVSMVHMTSEYLLRYTYIYILYLYIYVYSVWSLYIYNI